MLGSNNLTELVKKFFLYNQLTIGNFPKYRILNVINKNSKTFIINMFVVSQHTKLNIIVVHEQNIATASATSSNKIIEVSTGAVKSHFITRQER